MSSKFAKWVPLLLGLMVAGTAAAATTYKDNFQSGSASLDWTALNDACLTAGDGSGTIPSCLSKGFLTDDTGQGALLLTPANNNQTGAILSAFAPFPLSQGIQVTFTTYTFGGDSGGTANNGADGIVFFLTDGTQLSPTKTGGEGGSMGYSCSNGNNVYDGVAYGYLGLGIDEFGNYLNSGDNSSAGIYNSNNTANGTTANGTNSYVNNVNGGIAAGSGGQYQPERIGLRGAGNTNWAWLQSQNSDYYSGSSPNKGQVQAACKSGQYYARVKKHNGTYQNVLTDIPFNYNPIPDGYAVLPNGEPIANNSKSATRNPPAGTTPCVGNSPVCDIAWPITYKLTISASGLLNFAYSYNNGTFQPVLVNTDITASNGPLPASLRFGFSAGTGGDNNAHEITCFEAAPLQSNSSAAANTVQSGEVKTGTQIYLASYSSDNWWGSLQAIGLNADPSTGAVSIASQSNWDAKCVLTGGLCDSMGLDADGNPTTTIAVQAPADRSLLTWNGGGVPLEWADLSTAQQTELNTSTDGSTPGQDRLAWLRGDRTKEQLQSTSGYLRARSYVLGDIIDSGPTWVGAPYSNTYPNSFSDGLYGNTSGEPENQSDAQTYSTFASDNATRMDVVYVGSNDGFLHGFRAGANGAGGAYDSTDNDGHEILGFLPKGVLEDKVDDLTSPTYPHDYLVDATPGVGDVFYGGEWHTWLVGGVGSAGKEIYALDVTDPSSFSESNASSLVIGDWTNNSSGLANLGNTVGTPVIARMHNGQWAIIFGTGQGGSGNAGVYIGLIDKTTGAVTFQPLLDTGVSNDSLTYVTSVDLDGDHIADYLYAGDTKGNVWRFDVTSNDPNKWGVSKFGTSKATPLFVAKDATTGAVQPITTAVTVASVVTAGQSRDLIFFGTGQKTPFTISHGDQFVAGTQTFYGIWDWDMTNWNSLSSVKYASLSGTQTIARSSLLTQVLASTETASTDPTSQVLGYRSLSTDKSVCWKGSTSCTSGNTEYGWSFDLPDTQEQIVYNPVIISGAVVVSTAIPATISAKECNAGQQSGWTMAFNPATGGGTGGGNGSGASGGSGAGGGFFAGPDGSFGAASDGSTIGGVRLDAVGSPTAVTSQGHTVIVSQTVKSTPVLDPINPLNGNSSSRVSWKEIRG